MIKLIVAIVLLTLAITFSSRRSHGAEDDGWHDIPCGESPIKQPESYDGPIQCRASSTHDADIGSGRGHLCWFRQYQMYYGRAIKGAEPKAPAVYMGADLSEVLSSGCWLKMGDESAARKEIHKLGTSWVGGIDWLAVRKISGGYAEQFAARDGRRCVGFAKLWQGLTSMVYGVYCDPPNDVPLDQPYTDDEIKTRVGVVQLDD